MQGHRVQVVKLLPSAPHRRDEVRLLQSIEVLRDRLPAHREMAAQLAQRLPVLFVEGVEQPASGRAGEGAEDGVDGHESIMQVITCMSRREFGQLSTLHRELLSVDYLFRAKSAAE